MDNRNLTKIIGSTSSLFVLLTAVNGWSCGIGGISITNLPTLGGSALQINAMNALGQLGGFSNIPGDTCAHAFFYANGSLQDLGTLGGSVSQARAINNAGQVVGDSNLPGDTSSPHAFSFSGSTLLDLGTLGGDYSSAKVLNEAGQIAGESTDINGITHGFLYSGGSMIDLGTLGGDYSSAIAINNSGTVVGNSYTTGNLEFHGFSYSNGTMLDLGTLGGNYSSASAINDAGQVVGEASLLTGEVHAFIYSQGIMSDLGTLGGTFSSAKSINSVGQIIGTASTAGDAEYHGFIYGNGTMTDLGTLGGNYSTVQSFNSLGQVVGDSATIAGISHAFLWKDGVMKDLNAYLPANSGWELNGAFFISDAGRIVGYGSYNGNTTWYSLDQSEGSNLPVAVAGPDQTVGCNATVTLNGSASTGESPLIYQWTEAGHVLSTEVTLVGSFDPGNHIFTLKVTDACGDSAQTNVVVHVVDQGEPVIVSVPGSIKVSADANCNAVVPDVASKVVATDNCSLANQLVITQSPAAGTIVDKSQNGIIVTVTDLAGNHTSTNVSFKVVDKTAPVIKSITTTPSILNSQSNNKKVNVTLSVIALDNCDAAPKSKILSITSNRSRECDDIEITGNLTAKLEVKNDDGSSPRVYTFCVLCTDASGNSSKATTTLTVSKTAARR
ncbi:MAG: hypothetical protein JWQ71_5073 [Pedosphaera sp.]|nr:hypothetical protein [Pedosphaera sp.]